MPWVIPDPGEPLDERRDARQGPQVRLEPVRPRPIPQRRVDPGQLRMVQPGPPAQPAGRRETVPTVLFPSLVPMCAVWRQTPYRATTTVCDAPRANRRAAANRRASSAAISSFLAMSHHGMVAHEARHVISRDSLGGPDTGRRAAGSARRRCTPRDRLPDLGRHWRGNHGRSTQTPVPSPRASSSGRAVSR